MLAVRTYPQDLPPGLHRRMPRTDGGQLAACNALVSVARDDEASALAAAVESFEPLFFSNRC